MWKPIDTLEFKKGYHCDDTRNVLFNVDNGYTFTGIVVGNASRYTRDDGTVWYQVDVPGVSGWEREVDFEYKNITHWMELPEPPSA